MDLSVNGQSRTIADADVDPNMPLLWVIRDVLNLTGTKFGCGVAACGACTVHVDGQAVRSCVTPLASVQGKAVRTIEALGSADQPHALQKAWVLLYPEGMVKLNGSAGEIMHRLDGAKTVQAVIDELESQFDATGLAPDVLDFLAIAQRQGWVKS